MIKKTHVYTTILEKNVFEKYETPAGIVEVAEGSEKPEGGRLIGWRTECRKVKYGMPIDTFMEMATVV